MNFQSSEIGRKAVVSTDGQSTAALVNSTDWSRHPLGEPSAWPLGLRLALNMLFNNRQPVCLFWGKENWYFYNDGYIPIVSEAKHPWAMGRSGAEVWAEIWPDLLPQIEQVRRGAGSTWHVDQFLPVLKDGKPTESYFTYSYSPVFLENDQIGGTLVTCTETTGAVLARRAEKKARDELIDREEYFRKLVDSSPGILWKTDVSGMCTYLSKAWSEFTGRPTELDLGLGWTENIHPDDYEEAKQGFINASAARVPFLMDYRLLTREGQYRWVVDSGLPRHDEEGNFLGMVGTVTDIHDVYQLRERFERSARATGLGVWYCDLPFADLIWDATVKEHFWLPPEGKVTIETFYERIHPEDRDRTRAAIADSNEHAAPYDIYYRTTNPANESEIKWIRAIGWTDFDQAGKPVRFDGVTLDMTEQKLAEQRVYEALRARDEFLSIASHELKTPLTSLKLQSQLFKRLISRDDPAAYSRPRMEQFAEQADRQTHRLSRLVDDMLDIGRIRTGKLSLSRERFDLCELVREVAARMHGQFTLADYREPEIVACEGAVGEWDRMRIEQVLANLFTNAIRYGEKKIVHVSVRRSGPSVRIEVRDEGMGISKADQAKIFNRFERAVNANEVSGLGLGLYISRQIVEAHGGEISVESELGKGSIFTVVLPLQPVEPARAQAIL